MPSIVFAALARRPDSSAHTSTGIEPASARHPSGVIAEHWPRLVLLPVEQGEERLVDASAVRDGKRPYDAFAGEAGPLEHALGCRVPQVHIGRNPDDAERECVLGQQALD